MQFLRIAAASRNRNDNIIRSCEEIHFGVTAHNSERRPRSFLSFGRCDLKEFGRLLNNGSQLLRGPTFQSQDRTSGCLVVERSLGFVSRYHVGESLIKEKLSDKHTETTQNVTNERNPPISFLLKKVSQGVRVDHSAHPIERYDPPRGEMPEFRTRIIEEDNVKEKERRAVCNHVERHTIERGNTSLQPHREMEAIAMERLSKKIEVVAIKWPSEDRKTRACAAEDRPYLVDPQKLTGKIPIDIIVNRLGVYRDHKSRCHIDRKVIKIHPQKLPRDKRPEKVEKYRAK